MDGLVKDADMVICETKTMGKQALSYSDAGIFRKVGSFMEASDEYNIDDIESVYMCQDGKLTAMPVKKFKSLYKAIKSMTVS